jgi:hypothetical protein
VIRESYFPAAPPVEATAWDDAVAKMVERMKAQNLRPRAIADYEAMVKTFRKVMPKIGSPAQVTPDDAQAFKVARSKKVEAATVAGNLNKLSVIWNKWWREECHLVATNPWADVEHPKLDEPQPRYIEAAEQERFFAWLSDRYNGWRLPVLFFEVKALVGRRLLQLASLPSDCLKDGRIVFESRSCKGRRMEYALLPPKIYEELRRLAGPRYLWGRHTEELRAIHRRQGHAHHAKCLQPFAPERFAAWLQDAVDAFNDAHADEPGYRRFTPHNFRDTAMTRAWDADVPIDKAAIAFGCHGETMKKHYVRKN